MPSLTASPSSRLRFTEVTALLALALALAFVLAYQPVARRAELMDRPLRQAWDSFARTNQSSAATAGVLEAQLPARLRMIELATGELSELRRLAFERVRLSPTVLRQLEAPFQLIDFDNERLRIADQVVALARNRKVQFQPGATNGLPQYPSPSAPAFLWPRLHLAHQVLLTAIHCQVGAIVDLNQLPPVSHRSPLDDRRLYEEMPMRVEVAGPIEPLARFLASLPLQGAELDRTGLADVLTNKPSLFIRQVLVRKSDPARPNDARLEVVVSGLVSALPARRNL